MKILRELLVLQELIYEFQTSSWFSCSVRAYAVVRIQIEELTFVSTVHSLELSSLRYMKLINWFTSALQ